MTSCVSGTGDLGAPKRASGAHGGPARLLEPGTGRRSPPQMRGCSPGAATIGPIAIPPSPRPPPSCGPSRSRWTARPWWSGMTVLPSSTPCIAATRPAKRSSTRSTFWSRREDLRRRPPSDRKAKLARLLARPPAGIAHRGGWHRGIPARLQDGHTMFYYLIMV
jgi:hypothetical protein